MAVRVKCAHCQSSVNVPETLQGKTIRCPHCKEPIKVKGPAAPRNGEQSPPQAAQPTKKSPRAGQPQGSRTNGIRGDEIEERGARRAPSANHRKQTDPDQDQRRRDDNARNRRRFDEDDEEQDRGPLRLRRRGEDRSDDDEDRGRRRLRDRDREDSDDDDRSQRRRRKQKSSAVGMWIAGGVGALVLVSSVIGGIIWFAWPPQDAAAIVKHVPKGGDAAPAIKDPGLGEVAPTPKDVVPDPAPAQKKAEEGDQKQKPDTIKQPDDVKKLPDAKPPVVANQPVPIPDGPTPDFIQKETIKKVKRATAYLKVTGRDGRTSEGSGFFAMEPGIVLTNAHVVDMMQANSPTPQKVEIVAYSGTPEETRFDGTVLGADRENDLAVVRVNGDLSKLPSPLAVELDGSSLTELQKVFIFGFPLGSSLGKEITTSESSVSSLRRDVDGLLYQIQVNGGISPGNSGGPVVDTRGVVVGVAVAIIKGTQINFAVPSEKIQGMLHGRVEEAHIGDPFQDKQTVKLPLKLSCLDPLKRIQEVNLEVWTGPVTPGRAASLKPPAALPGDGARQTIQVNYQQGKVQHDLVLSALKLPAGHCYWIQPMLTTTTGVKHWASATAFDPEKSPPLERNAVNLTFKTETAQRSLNLQSKIEIKVKDKVADGDYVSAEVLEVLETLEPKKIKCRLAVGKSDFAMHDGTRLIKRNLQARNLAMARIYAFDADLTGRLFVFTFPNFKHKNINIQLEAEDLSSLFNTSYQAVCLSVPNRQVSPLETWPTKITLYVGTGKKKTPLDLVLTCNYQGSRQINGKTHAMLRLTGQLEARKGTPTTSRPKDRITGHALFDVDGGFFTKVNIVMRDEGEFQGVLFTRAMEFDVARVAGNTFNIKVPPPSPPPADKKPPNDPPGKPPNNPPGKPLGKPVPNAPAQPPPPAGTPGKTTVDLIPMIEPSRDPQHGRWLIVDKTLHCNDSGLVPRIHIPYQPPAEYDFIVTFSQPKLRNGINLIMPNPLGGAFCWVVGTSNGKDGMLLTNPEKRQPLPSPIVANQIHTTIVQVRRDSVRVLLDGVEIMNRKTDFRDLICDNWRKMNDVSVLAIGCDDPTVFHYIQVVEITGTGKKVTPGSPPPAPKPPVNQPGGKPLGTPVPNPPPQPPPPAGTPGKASVDLIPMIEPSRDPQHGRWLIVDKTLHCSDSGLVPRIHIPYQPPAEYDFIVTFSQPTLRNGISLIMPNPNGGSFAWIVGCGNGSEYCLLSQPEKRLRLPNAIIPYRTYTTIVQVRRDSVKVLLDGGEIINRNTDFRDLICDNWRKMNDTSVLSVGCDDPTVFHYIQVVEITGSGKKVVPGSSPSAGSKPPVNQPPDVKMPEAKPNAQVADLAGKWKIKYTNGAQRVYTIEQDGRVSFPGENRKGQIQPKDSMLLLVFDGDDRLERLTLRVDGTLFVEHYNPKSNFPNMKATVTGVGTREKQPSSKEEHAAFLGTWEGRSGIYSETWTFQMREGKLSITGTFKKDDKIVGQFEGKEVKYANGKVSFRQMFSLKPAGQYEDLTEITATVNGNMLSFSYRNSRSSGTGTMTRSKAPNSGSTSP